MKVYIANTWIITAFKIAAAEPPVHFSVVPDNKKGETPKNVGLKATAVRMTFKTERAFFPYREPTDQRDAHARNTPRLLRLFVAARQRMEGTIGESTSWPGKTVWSNAISEAERGELLSKAKLPSETAQGKWRLTEFEDRSSPRPGTDELYFAPAADQGNVAREPRLVTYENPWWLGPALIVLIAIWRDRVRNPAPVRGPAKTRRTGQGPGIASLSEPPTRQQPDPGRWFYRHAATNYAADGRNQVPEYVLSIATGFNPSHLPSRSSFIPQHLSRAEHFGVVRPVELTDCHEAGGSRVQNERLQPERLAALPFIARAFATTRLAFSARGENVPAFAAVICMTLFPASLLTISTARRTI